MTMMRRLDAIKSFVRLRTDEICICGVGVSGRELYSAGHHPLNLYNVNMPYPLALAFGVLIVFLVMIGTIWIMGHMNVNMGPSPEMMNLQMQH